MDKNQDVVEAAVWVTKKYERLWQGLKHLSVSQKWETAKLEWTEMDIEILKAPEEQCVCGRKIKNLFHVKNSSSGERAIVGSECIITLTGTNPVPVFTNLNNVRADRTKALNEACLMVLARLKIISEWERAFLQDTLNMKYKSMSTKRALKRLAINEKVIAYVNRRQIIQPHLVVQKEIEMDSIPKQYRYDPDVRSSDPLTRKPDQIIKLEDLKIGEEVRVAYPIDAYEAHSIHGRQLVVACLDGERLIHVLMDDENVCPDLLGAVRFNRGRTAIELNGRSGEYHVEIKYWVRRTAEGFFAEIP